MILFMPAEIRDVATMSPYGTESDQPTPWVGPIYQL